MGIARGTMTDNTADSIASAREIVEIVNRRHGAALRLVEQAPAGESHPWMVTDKDGRRYLLKWSSGPNFHIQRAVTLTNRLRQRGYPIPAYLLTGRDDAIGYAVRELVAGQQMTTPMHPLDQRYLPRLFELNEMQNGAAAGVESSWRETIFTSILVGFRQWCVLDALRNYSDETAAMLAEMQERARSSASVAVRTSDAMHGDFNGSNVLVDQRGSINAVIDWEGSGAGDRAFDLATLLFYDYLNAPVRKALLARILAVAEREAVAIYLAHMVIRQLEWSISHHPKRVVDYYLRIARAILSDMNASILNR